MLCRQTLFIVSTIDFLLDTCIFKLMFYLCLFSWKINILHYFFKYDMYVSIFTFAVHVQWKKKWNWELCNFKPEVFCKWNFKTFLKSCDFFHIKSWQQILLYWQKTFLYILSESLIRSRIKTIWIIYKLWVFCIHQIYYLFRIEIFFVHVNGHSSVNSVICSWSLRLNTKQITRIKKTNVPLPDIQDCHLLSCNRSRYGKIHALRNWSGLLQMSPCLRHFFFRIKRWHRVHTDLTNWSVLFNDWAI